MLAQDIITSFTEILKPGHCMTDQADCMPYSYDNILQGGIPDAVLFATTEAEIRAIIALCYEQAIPVTCRGRGTGTVGGSVATQGGIVLSLERMQKIISIDPNNRTATVEPGITNQALQDALKPYGFFWAPDPSSAAFCTVGGNLAYGSAGPRAVKYGTARENTLALTAITGTGDVLKTGAHTTKSVVGYDLTRLLVGSEGTLAVITSATLKLTPLAEKKFTLRLDYKNFEYATEAVATIMAQPITPCALEFIDKQSIQMIRDYSSITPHPDTNAILMIEVDGSAESIQSDVDKVLHAATNQGLIQSKQAESKEEVAELWKMRKALSPALKHVAPKKINEDVVVPVSHMPELIAGVETSCNKHQIKFANFGHAGNGNIHVNLLVDHNDKAELKRAETCLDEIFTLVLSLNGSLSGEHGIGTAKQAFIERELGQSHIGLMKKIKQSFDPKGILNPGKIWLS